MKLKDKVAIVVGGGSGIGRASATLLAQEGARVMIADLSLERANKVAENIMAMPASEKNSSTLSMWAQYSYISPVLYPNLRVTPLS